METTNTHVAVEERVTRVGARAEYGESSPGSERGGGDGKRSAVAKAGEMAGVIVRAMAMAAMTTIEKTLGTMEMVRARMKAEARGKKAEATREVKVAGQRGSSRCGHTLN